jgi:hypothetical protein
MTLNYGFQTVNSAEGRIRYAVRDRNWYAGWVSRDDTKEFLALNQMS